MRAQTRKPAALPTFVTCAARKRIAGPAEHTVRPETFTRSANAGREVIVDATVTFRGGRATIAATDRSKQAIARSAAGDQLPKSRHAPDILAQRPSGSGRDHGQRSGRF